MPLPILIHLHVYFFMLKMPDPTTSPSKVLILGTRPSISSKKRVGWSEEDEDVGLPLELERIIAQEDREMRPHQEEIKLIDLGTGSGKKEVKIGTGMNAPVREELMVLLKNYQDIFA